MQSVISKKTTQQYRRIFQKRWVTPVTILAIIFCLFFVLHGVRQHVNHAISGDEPHYLLMDYSIKVDHDLNLKNNYTNLDYFRYYPDYTPNHVSPKNLDTEGSGWYSFHGVGLPLLLLPGFLLNERTVPVIMMTIFSVVALALTALWCYKLTGSKKYSLTATLILASCYFFNGLSGYIYPDMLIAALILGLLLIITFYFHNSKYQLLYGALLGSLVVIHPKTLSLVLPFLGIAIYKQYRKNKTLPWFVVAGGLPFAILFFVSLWRWYGTLNPASIYPTYLGVVSPFKSVLASLFDSQRGLLVYNPVLILVFSGVIVWYRASKETLYATLIVLAPAYLVTICFSEWWGGYAPAGRYLMNYIPALMPAVAYVLMNLRKKYEYMLAGSLVTATVMFTLAATYMKTPYPSGQPRSEFFTGIEDRIGIGFDKLLPHYTLKTDLVGQFAEVKVLICTISILPFIYFGYNLAQRHSVGSMARKSNR